MGARRGNQNAKSVEGGRKFLRSLADDPRLRELVRAAIVSELEQGKTDSYFRAFQHGYGNPPQALDVRHGNLEGETLVFDVVFSDGDAVFPTGDPTATSTLPVPAKAPE